MEELPTELNIVTLNCWGLKYISKLRNERLSEIGRQLAIADPSPHIVALQECFTQEDYKAIRRETRFILPYGKFYFSGPFGGGLAILSKWPIEESTLFRYPLNGRPTAFWRGDWYVGKGVACAKIRYGPAAKQVIEVFCTHTHSPYEGGQPDDSYLAQRLAQSWEISKLLRGAAERGHLVLGCGDFNMIPMSLEHQLVTANTPVRDVWRVLHPDSSLGPADHPAEKARRRPIPTAEFNIEENGAASDGPYCTWRWTKEQQKLLGPGKPAVTIPPDTIDRRGKRLDYIFAGSGDIPSLNGGWVVKTARVGMMMRHPELGCSLSDHFAVEATLAFHPLSSSSSPSSTSKPLKTASNGNSAANGDDSLILKAPPKLQSSQQQQQKDDDTIPDIDDKHVQDGTYLQSPTPSSIRDNSSYDAQLLSFLSSGHHQLPISAYDFILQEIQKYRAREEKQKKWRGWHFFGSLMVLVGCLVGVWWSPANYVAFVLVLVSSLSLVAGTVDGLMSLLFFRSELGALREFEWEVMNAKASAGGGVPPPTAGGEGEERGW
ncbi:Endonuclease/exonuclease/phosphatase [Apiosordaria backusii]|uniref:Endonuclease/exonuclease/phosphatase n=1 Tax=Apiosordaria backusii TaxID=314023 RepID=A0AA40K6N2_9PEZI|nr:Endonuclease/exonuclease/phosphatase [Apiosordaria backusii]